METAPKPPKRAPTSKALLVGFIAAFAWVVIAVLIGTFSPWIIIGGSVGFVIGTTLAALIPVMIKSRSKPPN